MKSAQAVREDFSSAHATPSLEQLASWKEQGYTDIVLFGRLQPPHRGHMALLETLRTSGLNVNLVLNDKTDNIEGERNPFSPHQREEMARMAMPWLPKENIRHANVYLGGGGDVGDAVRRLGDIFNDIADDDKLVFAYYEKAEDRKRYLVDGEVIDGAHYVELVGQPRGRFPIQRVTREMIEQVADFVPIDAKMFREGVRQEDELCFDLLDPKVAQYVREQIMLADVNGRLVGEDPSSDNLTFDDLPHLRNNAV